ncbi:Tll0287-like domain-containing protein [Nitratifractor salsuginis]|uniref:Cytochrome c family protein n=1 Tax=Nitratifractor salsuginis (strain DSM 16511 / JCM 12458 / E9I37-1) TaxID=749222 RepID=E6X349_NITSE|nr:DUF3365 domain-containing protein [Nitratifractor salsuginis]ADV46193.1 cytochrome c family protein [Nitratifractor salsuginis DSM 16511]
MKKSLILISLAAALSLSAAEQPASQQKAVAAEGVKYIKILGKELKGKLVKYLKQDPSGLQGAYFCSKSAQRITKEVNAKFPDNIKVRRTALKYRNPDNKPDATDVKVMEQMEAAAKAGKLEKKPVVVKVGETERVYVPLIAQKACLKCHGPVEKIDPKVKETIAKHYPDDKAVGFHEGDLRGVVVAEIAPEAK